MMEKTTSSNEDEDDDDDDDGLEAANGGVGSSTGKWKLSINGQYLSGLEIGVYFLHMMPSHKRCTVTSRFYWHVPRILC